MSFLTRLFRKKPEEDYETILSSLAFNIQKIQVKLSEIRLRERRSTLLVTLYTLAAWVAYVSLWYMQLLPNAGGRGRARGVETAIKVAPVVVGPIIILFVRRIVQVWYKKKGDAEEKILQNLLKQQRSKVEEIKKKTNFYSTRDLIQRYDESMSSPGLPQRLVPGPTQPSTPQRPMTQNINPRLLTPNPLNGLSPQQQPLLSVPTRKQWYDKLADVLLGDDDHTPNASAARYALICEKCFAHNGLVKESMWEDAQYVCPKCQHFNPSARAKKQGPGHSPVSSPSATPPRAPSVPVTPQQSPGSPPKETDTSMMEVDAS